MAEQLQLALPPWQMLLMCYGLAYFFRHKCTWLMGRAGWLDWMLECTFCLGGHAGWVTWLLFTGINGDWLLPTWWGNGLCATLWVFVGAGGVCIIDAVVRCFEDCIGDDPDVQD